MDCITVLEYPGEVVAIDSGQIRPQMACCYLLETPGAVAVIETGNNASADRIMKVLDHRGRRPEDVTHVIVTHVHLDHAGGAGRLMEMLPGATLVVHPYGARHMIDPSRLESSARSVYGDEVFDKLYGSPIPVPDCRVLVMEEGGSIDVGGRELTFMDTAGHARHHFCVWDEQTRGWFTGDTFGLVYRELKTSRGAFAFPTTTPVQFDPPVLLQSVNRMVERNPACMYPTHFGRVEFTAELAEQMRSSINRTVEIGEAFRNKPDRTRLIEEAMDSWLVKDILDHGVQMSSEELSAWLAMDISLNAQGLECWLDQTTA